MPGLHVDVIGSGPPAVLLQHGQGALGHQVVRREHPVHVRSLGQQPFHGRASTGDGEVALRPGHVRVAVHRHGRVEPGQPVLAGHRAVRPGDRGDVPAAARHQVVGGEPGAQLLVDVDVAQRHRPRRPGEQYGGQPGVGQHSRQRVLGIDRDHQAAVHLAAAQVADQLRAGLGGVDQHQHQVAVVRAQVAHHAGQGAAEERVGEDLAGERLGERLGGGHGQGHQAGTPGHQGTGRAVGHVAGGGDRLLHDALDLRVDVARLVDDPGHRRPGHPGDPRHVIQRERTRERWIRGHPVVIAQPWRALSNVVRAGTERVACAWQDDPRAASR